MDGEAAPRGQWLDATAVASILDCSVSRVYALAAQGWLPTIRLGRRVKFPAAALRAIEEAAAGAVVARQKPSAHQTTDNIYALEKSSRDRGNVPGTMVGARAKRSLSRKRDDYVVKPNGVVHRKKGRGNGWGSVFERSDRLGRYVAQWKPIGAKRYKTLTFARQEDALAFLERMRATERNAFALSLYRVDQPIDEIVEDLADRLFAKRGPNGIEYATRTAWLWSMTLLREVMPTKSERVLARFLEPSHVILLQQRLKAAVANGRGHESANRVLSTLSSVCDRIRKLDGYVPPIMVNPFQHVAKLEDPKVVVVVDADDNSDVEGVEDGGPRRYTFEEIRAAVALFHSTHLYPVIAVLVGGGLRPGEVAGLVMGNYDRTTGRLSVRRAIKKDNVRRLTKTGDTRDIVLPVRVRRVLEAYLTWRDPNGDLPAKAPLLVNRYGRRWTPDTLYQAVSDLASAVGIKFFPYAGRHAFMTTARLAGLTDVEMSLWSGHAVESKMNRLYGNDELPTSILSTMTAKLDDLASALIAEWSIDCITKPCARCDERFLPTAMNVAQQKYCLSCGPVVRREQTYASRRRLQELRRTTAA